MLGQVLPVGEAKARAGAGKRVNFRGRLEGRGAQMGSHSIGVIIRLHFVLGGPIICDTFWPSGLCASRQNAGPHPSALPGTPGDQGQHSPLRPMGLAWPS